MKQSRFILQQIKNIYVYLKHVIGLRVLCGSSKKTLIKKAFIVRSLPPPISKGFMLLLWNL